MSTKAKFLSILLSALAVLTLQTVHSQDKVSWLDDYTGAMLIGTDTYQYSFSNVERNDCKLKIKEVLTDKKGTTEERSWVFYLSDIDPSSVSFKAKGKAISISMETHRSQKFISYYQEGELYGYTNEIIVQMNEVDMTRSFIETIKEKMANCEATQEVWEDWDEAFIWLMNNVEKATDDETEWDQKFEQGSRSYLVNFEAKSVDEKGIQESFYYTIDLSDINPQAIDLKISGKSLIVELSVKEGKRYIKVDSPSGSLFTNELLIYAPNIELARQTVKALSYVVNNTTPERPQWDSYGAALGFVKDNLGEVNIGDEQYSNSLDYEVSPSGIADFTIGKSESGGSPESTKYSLYLADLDEKLKFEVSKSSITIRMETKNDRDFISVIKDGAVSDYTSTLGFHVPDIDMARDILNALEYAVRNSEENITEFSEISEVRSWFSENIGSVDMDGDKYEQNLTIAEEIENQLIIDKKLVEADGGTIDTRFIIYPEDISLDKLDIKVSGKKLYVPLTSAQSRYIKNFENDELQDFTSSVEILFLDPLAAKNFMAAIRFIKENSEVEERSEMTQEAAIAFLSGNIQSLDLPGKKYEQKFEVRDEQNCKMSFTRVETDSKGTSNEYIYEFIVTDIHPDNSKFSIKGELISVNLVIVGNKKLVKPYKNGEAGDFVDDFVIYADDILLAKKILAAFSALSRVCK